MEKVTTVCLIDDDKAIAPSANGHCGPPISGSAPQGLDEVLLHKSTNSNVTFAGLPCNLQSVQKPVAIPAREERQDLPLVWDDANLTQVWICLALLNR